MATIYDTAAEARRRLLAGESAAAQNVLYAYGRAVSDIQDRLRDLVDAITATGGTATPAQLARLNQWANLLQTLSDANDELAKTVGGSVKKQQLKALEYAADDAQRQVTQLVADAGGFVPLYQPVALEAMQALVGTTESGPLVKVIAGNNYQTYTKTKRALTTGLAAGRDLRALAKEVQGIWGESLTRSLALVRTETMRAYREGSRAQYAANSDVVKGWRWLAARSTRTCPACLALDGQEFELDQPMPAHVNCRCTMIPVLRNRDTPSTRQTGQQYFDGLTDANKRKIVGKAGLAAVKNGATLADFVHWREDAEWGRQALWSVPKGGSATPGKVADPRPRLPNGMLADYKDAISAAKAEFQKWKTAANSTDDPQGWLDWLQFEKGMGAREYDYNDFTTNPKKRNNGVTLQQLATAADKMQKGFDRLPTMAPSVQAAMKTSKPWLDVHDDMAHNGYFRASATTDYVAQFGKHNGRISLNMSNYSSAFDVYAHEYLHHVESRLGLSDRHAAWVISRKTGPMEWLGKLTGNKGYGHHETAYPDTYLHPYVGKPYPKLSSNLAAGYYGTEVLTMGGEELVKGNAEALAFMRDHEDHFWLVIAALLGL